MHLNPLLLSTLSEPVGRSLKRSREGLREVELVTEKKKKLDKDSLPCKGLCHSLRSPLSEGTSRAFPGACPLSSCLPHILKPG